MSSYRSYTVVLKDKTEFKIMADDVDLDRKDEVSKDENAYFNFLKNTNDDVQVTVAAVPFDNVLYIVSS